jgi:hypothetical protein
LHHPADEPCLPAHHVVRNDKVKTFHSQTIWCNTADFTLTARTINFMQQSKRGDTDRES